MNLLRRHHEQDRRFQYQRGACLPHAAATRIWCKLAKANGLSQEAAQAVAAIDADDGDSFAAISCAGTLVAGCWRWSIPALDISHFDVIGAIAYNPNWGDSNGEEVTVGLIAERLGIDPSRASRVVAEVVDRGYARRVASQSDARRICLELTPQG